MKRFFAQTSLLAILLGGCEFYATPDGRPDDLDCNSCHGNEENAAPPVSVFGDSDPSLIAVGAHQDHLHDSALRRAIDCDECHIVPDTVDAEGHIDGLPAEVIFGELASAQGADPVWDREEARCLNTYCHGATLAGGVVTDPLWTEVDGSQVFCGSCHGVPPPPPHPTFADCRICHPGTVKENGEIDIAGGLHMDGKVDLGEPSCTACHGSDGNPAPPVDTQGNASTADPGVGAHRAHLGESFWHATLECTECHRVPETLTEEGHIDTPLPAELIWGPLASADGADPSYSHPANTCSGVYCHGATLKEGGGRLTQPDWTVVDGSQDACGTCHGLPPGGDHPPRGDCHSCHGMVIAPDFQFLAPELHINGQVNVAPLGCDLCHGSDGNPAPPLDTQGNASPTDPGVGAHREHLAPADWHGEIACAECHRVPTEVDDPGHIDAPPAELVWGPLASADGAQPDYDYQELTCSGVYCHGATLEGEGRLTQPQWTVVDGSQDACGTCHGLPPGGDHPNRSDCVACHGQVVGSGLEFIAPELHINGQVELTLLSCDLCHGSDGNPAPPLDLQGNESTSEPGVGAHRQHLGTSGWHGAIACDQCHVVPASVDAPGHNDTPVPAELVWGDLASAEGAVPLYSQANQTCSGVYCHGATLDGGSLTQPDWTVVDGSQAACGACHGLPPGGDHPNRSDCAACHGQVVGSGLEFIAPELHINGQVELTLLSCDLCHGRDGNPAPPLDLEGNESTAEPGVGAHRSHLGTSDWRGEIGCDQCHVVPASVDAPGHRDTPGPAELVWGGLASADGADPAYISKSQTCSGVYCHGATLGGGRNIAPTWTLVDGSQAACGTCHGLPPPSPHPSSNECADCHGSVINENFSFADPARHVNGTIDF